MARSLARGRQTIVKWLEIPVRRFLRHSMSAPGLPVIVAPLTGAAHVR
jgi:hypothetical protein